MSTLVRKKSPLWSDPFESAHPKRVHGVITTFWKIGMHEHGLSIPFSVSSAPGLGSVREDENEGEDEVGDHFGEGSSGRPFYVQDDDDDDGGSEESADVVDEDVLPREDTTRRGKRFSLPAVALQTTPVIARAHQEDGWRSGSSGEDGDVGNGVRKRFSLVLGGGTKEKNRREREGERDSSAVGLLMDVRQRKVGPRKLYILCHHLNFRKLGFSQSVTF
ncbi:hypothetical protein HYDPIDRAFT_167490 [Hydnomerulius pinastri MD-312]|uniref:Uncharacterized protein n=1 Tax=Hydnomerulius pinastri MD-312 TaxID=994086 RepID=A0A0C9WFY2_9AGAM|nr:hypothetical protein HYDPIDRAFT_167490 [Hydnomerulius pinastri MD-312]